MTTFIVRMKPSMQNGHSKRQYGGTVSIAALTKGFLTLTSRVDRHRPMYLPGTICPPLRSRMRNSLHKKASEVWDCSGLLRWMLQNSGFVDAWRIADKTRHEATVWVGR